MYCGPASLIDTQLPRLQELIVRGFCGYVGDVIVQQHRETVRVFLYTTYEREGYRLSLHHVSELL